MDMCHEMSHSRPTTTIAAETTTAHACHAEYEVPDGIRE
jgi:hypothetical protein